MVITGADTGTIGCFVTVLLHVIFSPVLDVVSSVLGLIL